MCPSSLSHSSVSSSKDLSYCKCLARTCQRRIQRKTSLFLVQLASLLQKSIWQCSGHGSLPSFEGGSRAAQRPACTSRPPNAERASLQPLHSSSIMLGVLGKLCLYADAALRFALRCGGVHPPVPLRSAEVPTARQGHGQHGSCFKGGIHRVFAQPCHCARGALAPPRSAPQSAGTCSCHCCAACASAWVYGASVPWPGCTVLCSGWRHVHVSVPLQWAAAAPPPCH